MPSRRVLRFAPSPNGYLHLGHAFSALTVQAWARRLDGRMLLRIEDIDPRRSREEFVAAILHDLAWLGIAWEEPVLRQSEHMADYQAAAQRLANLGLLYPCFATRREIAVAADPTRTDPDGVPLYPLLHRGLPPAEVAERKARGEPFCLRLDMARALDELHRRTHGDQLTFDEMAADGAIQRITADPARWGDTIIVRKDVPTSYHLSVVVDDARQGVTHVTRGQDLRAATDLHRLLQVLLALPQPIYHHHPLILDVGGRKLAKSRGDIGLATLRRDGETAANIRKRLGMA